MLRRAQTSSVYFFSARSALAFLCPLKPSGEWNVAIVGLRYTSLCLSRREADTVEIAGEDALRR